MKKGVNTSVLQHEVSENGQLHCICNDHHHPISSHLPLLELRITAFRHVHLLPALS